MGVLLSVNNVVKCATWDQSWLEIGPLLRHHHTTNLCEIIVWIRRSKLHFMGHTLDLESAIGGKFIIKLEETSILIFTHWHVIHRCKHPFPVNSIEQILLNHVLMEEYFFNNRVANCGIFNQLHLLSIVKDKRIIILTHEEMLHLPLLFGYLFLNLAIAIHRQWEDNTLALQFSIGRKVEHKIIK